MVKISSGQATREAVSSSCSRAPWRSSIGPGPRRTAPGVSGSSRCTAPASSPATSTSWHGGARWWARRRGARPRCSASRRATSAASWANGPIWATRSCARSSRAGSCCSTPGSPACTCSGRPARSRRSACANSCCAIKCPSSGPMWRPSPTRLNGWNGSASPRRICPSSCSAHGRCSGTRTSRSWRGSSVCGARSPGRRTIWW